MHWFLPLSLSLTQTMTFWVGHCRGKPERISCVERGALGRLPKGVFAGEFGPLLLLSVLMLSSRMLWRFAILLCSLFLSLWVFRTDLDSVSVLSMWLYSPMFVHSSQDSQAFFFTLVISIGLCCVFERARKYFFLFFNFHVHTVMVFWVLLGPVLRLYDRVL